MHYLEGGEAMPKAAPVPEFTSDRLRLLGPLITPQALALARRRLVDHKQRITESDGDLATVRVALILLREINPYADLTNAEEGLLRGLNAETVGTRKAAGEL